MIMEVYIEDNKIAITKKQKKFHFDLSKDADITLKHQTCFIIKHNELLVEYAIKNKFRQLLFKYKHGNDIHEHGKQQNESTPQ